MPHIVPSQARQFIEQAFPVTVRGNPNFQFAIDWTSQLTALVTITELIPDELLTVTGATHSEYIWAREIIRQQLTRWIYRPEASYLPHVNGRSAVLVIYDVLQQCPDEAPSPATASLKFIDDTELRESIRLDISAANRDLVNHEYKGATVLAGSATEALLLWAIKEKDSVDPGASRAAISSLVATGALTTTPHSNPERWWFIELIEVAHQLKLIADATAQQARLSKDFRNLIHPGRAARLGKICDRGTALSALAAVEHIVRDLAC
jgi:hypothetical protein